MNQKELNNKINGIFLGIIIIGIIVCGILWTQISELQRQIDENKCVMGGGCPEINSILADKISEVLDRDGLTLYCKEYEQIEVLKYNISCEIINLFEEEYIQNYLSDKMDCEGRDFKLLKKEAVIIKEDGDCLKYEIVKK